MTAGEVSAKADELGRKAERSDLFDHAVRWGLVAYGTVHLLIAWLAVQLTLGDRAGSPSASGALSELAEKPFGRVLLWVVGLGFLALVAWQLVETLLGHRDQDGARRAYEKLKSAGRAVIYGALGVTALRIATGSGGSGGDGTDTLTARLMSLPLGQLLVGAVGLGVLAVAAAHVREGLAGDFRDKLESRGLTGASGRTYRWLGRLGYVSKGAALAVVGGLFVWAAWTHDPDESGGLDQALTTVLDQPFGAPLLLVIAVGLACYGLFCFAWARHLDR